ncbi:MAG: thioredoxin-like negative regulator of GroEL [Planctomycetota bacterium]|jgi:thioredoxin-like negative regulator of GroEL
MDTVTYPSPVMQTELQNWVFLQVNVDDHPEMQTYFGVSSIPVAVVMNASGEEAARWSGFEEADVMAAALAALRLK